MWVTASDLPQSLLTRFCVIGTLARWVRFAGLVGIVTAFTVPLLAQSGADYVAPRTSIGQPDLQGIWQARNTA